VISIFMRPRESSWKYIWFLRLHFVVQLLLKDAFCAVGRFKRGEMRVSVTHALASDPELKRRLAGLLLESDAKRTERRRWIGDESERPAPSAFCSYRSPLC